jgi:CDP-diacylglycerol--glycerol-3-phosphate 3-phosphatidyltransferase
MTNWLGPLEPLAPALFMSAYFIVMYILFQVRIALRGLPEDADVTKRSASKLLGRHLRHYLMWVLRPYERGLIKLGVSPNMITFASLLTAAASAWAFATGRFATGGWLYLFTGILDIFDGRIARATGRVSPGGAFFDSVMDRYAEMLVFGGMAYFYRDSWAMFLALGAALGSVMVSYTRARAEGLGVDDVNIGTMQRPERLFYLGVVSCLSPIPEALFGHGAWPMFPAVVVALALLGLSANITAIRRIMHTLARLEAKENRSAAAQQKAVVPPAPQPARVAPVLPLRAASGRN